MIAIDTTSSTQSVCFLEGDHLRSFYGERPSFSVQDLISQNKTMLKNAEVVLACIGPGQLTATRVGLSYIQGLIAATNLPVYGIKASLVRTAWMYWQTGSGVFTSTCKVDSKHVATAVYQWDEDAVVCLQDDTLKPVSDVTNDDFPIQSSAMLMCDLYNWLRDRNLLHLLSVDLKPIYLRSAV